MGGLLDGRTCHTKDVITTSNSPKLQITAVQRASHQTRPHSIKRSPRIKPPLAWHRPALDIMMRACCFPPHPHRFAYILRCVRPRP